MARSSASMASISLSDMVAVLLRTRVVAEVFERQSSG